MANITPFKIETHDADLEDLSRRLAAVRWPDRETPHDWSQGIPLSYMQEINEYWLNVYDWRAREERLNRWPGFRTEIDGLSFHFLHVESPEQDARPLLLTHGWPGSIVEFQKVIGPLTDPVSYGGKAEDAFHLVVPTLPGFGYSDKPVAPGWNVERIAEAWDTLMSVIGYEAWFAQGGDWGSIVTAAIGVQNRGRCKGIHMNMPIVLPDPETMDALTDLEKDALASMKFYQDQDSGYAKQQSTRPQTLGYGLADSPMGQAAWILEKFYQWMDCAGHPENVVTRDELLDNIMMYWLPDAGASSARIYWESQEPSMDRIEIPVGCSTFPKEIFKTSERWARKRFQNLVHFEVLEKGGHFAAFEQPDLFVSQLRACFAKISL